MDMPQNIKIGSLDCQYSKVDGSNRIVYILYPVSLLSEWIEPTSKKYHLNIVVVTGMDWESVFSPWPAKGVPAGSPDFKGDSPQFLKLLQQEVIPQVETAIGLETDAERTLVGVSMSGLFALWQWMLCDTFRNIASLSGSFWYEGFIEWMKSRSIPAKSGKAFFLLGDKESHSKVKAFNTVAQNTREIISLLQAAGISPEFESVPGDHYADPLPRLTQALTSLFAPIRPV